MFILRSVFSNLMFRRTLPAEVCVEDVKVELQKEEGSKHQGKGLE